MNRGLCLKFFVIFLLIVASSCNLTDLCGDNSWSVYKDEKCLKLIDQLVNREEAGRLCSELIGAEAETSDGSLLTIKSAAENEVIASLLFDEWQIVDYVWLGARRNQQTGDFQWDDGTSPEEFSNWAEGSPSNDTVKNCSEITSGFLKTSQREKVTGSTLSQWIDTSCTKRNLVVCQKAQRWPLYHMQKTLLELRSDNEKKSRQLSNLEKNPVPIGFVFVQLPDQEEPSIIWPGVEWVEITSSYAGLFFRAEGDGSSAFGSPQQESTREFTTVQYTEGAEAQNCIPGSQSPYRNPLSLPPAGWSEFGQAGYHWNGNGGQFRCHGLRFEKSAGEVRPKNTAVRIWKRAA